VSKLGVGLGDGLLATVGVHNGEASTTLKVVKIHVRADVHVSAVIRNLVVPAVELASLESAPNEAATALLSEDILGDGIKVPLGSCLLLECLEHGLGLRVIAGGQVGEFLGVGREVEELRWVDGAGDVLPRATADHHERCDGTLTHVLSEDSVVTLLASEVRHHRVAIHRQTGDKLSANHVAESGGKIESGDILVDTVRSVRLGVADKHRHADRALEVRHLVPQATLAKHVTMVTTENNDGVVAELALVQNIEQLANAVVDVRASTVVGTLGLLDLLGGEVIVLEVADVLQTLAVWVLVFLVDLNIGHVDVDILVHVPVLVFDGVRVMGVGERHGQGERSGVRALADVVVQVLSTLVHAGLVVVELVAANARTCLENGAAVVVPLKTGVGLVPVDSPAIVGRVDVGCESLLPTVQLITDEVHLAGQDGLVTSMAEVV